VDLIGRARFRILVLVSVLTFPSVVLAQSETAREAIELFVNESVLAPDSSQLEAALEEHLDSLIKQFDPYGRFYFRKDRPYGMLSIQRAFGFELFESDGRKYIMPFLDSPTTHAGVTDVAELVSIDGTSVAELSVEQAIDLLPLSKRSVDLKLVLGLENLDITIHAKPIHFQSIETIQLGKTSILRVRNFVRRETFDVMKAWLETNERDASPQKALIVDLRYCQGGELFAALNAASLLVPSGSTLAYLKDANGVSKKIDALPLDRTFDDLELFFWVSEMTASAAEAYVTAVKSHTNVVLVGAQTHGKCISQKEYSLSDGAGMILSNYQVLSPDERSCEGLGVEPDQPIDLPQLISTQNMLEVMR